MHRLLTVAFALCACLPALAQRAPSRPPTLLVQQEKKWTPLKVTKLDARVDVAGLIARARVTLTFHNPNDRVLQGELVFPLPEGATISGYGLDVKGTVVGASAVERQTARVAFETEVRKGIDPGLVEWVRGNVFRTRVYPIPAKGSRTIRVDYTVDLSSAPTIKLPLSFGAPIDEVSVQVAASGTGAAPVISGTALKLPFGSEHGRHVARATAKGVDVGELTLTLAKPPISVALVEQRSERGRPAHYFYLSLMPPKAGGKTPHSERPRRIAVIWDASLSRLRTDRAAELKVLADKLKALQTVEVDVYVVRNTVAPRKSFTIADGDSAALIAHLTKAPIDGGTRLDAISLERKVDWSLLCSDGLGTLGDVRPRLAGPVYAISASRSAHHALLRRLALRSGGSYFNLRRRKHADAVSGLGMPAARSIVSVSAPDGSVSDVLPSGRSIVDGRAVVAGRLLADEAELTVRYSDGGTQTVVVRKQGAGDSGLVPRLWAGMQVHELALFPDRNRARLIKIGKRFGLVTPHTSLLVLETLAQHLTHGILPPTSRPKLREQYIKVIETRGLQHRKARVTKLEQVKKWWAARRSWYAKSFTYPASFKYAEKLKKKPARRGRGNNAGGRPDESARGEEQESDDEEFNEAKGGGKKNGGSHAAPEAKIQIKAWDPKTPYMARLKDAGAGEAYAVYLEQRKDYAGSPAYYLDCSEYFLATKQRATALRVLTSILELEIDDAALLRVVAHRLKQLGEHDLAIGLFERVRRLRAEEPQSHRDLALALAARAKGEDHARAAALLTHVITGRWHGRFPQIEVIALTELNRIRARQPDLKVDLPTELLTRVDVDIRILLTWDADATDIDLWVVEPSGEKCMYNHNRTTIGGLMTKDFTQGYGPEVYLVKKAMPGNYKIQCNFYGSRQQKLTGGTTIQATVITNYGRPNETRKTLTVRLSKKKDVVDLGQITFGK